MAEHVSGLGPRGSEGLGDVMEAPGGLAPRPVMLAGSQQEAQLGGDTVEEGESVAGTPWALGEGR